ncbi:MAG: prenyltransferase/squalene oxidase repeat-containing protein [Pirellula sp.]
MNSETTKKSSSLIALDSSLLLLGMLVMLMVFKLFRFDDPNPIHNAWTYIIGVPTVLIVISMLTRVLTNDYVEKSIQLGFLISVGMHLFLMVAALNVVLFSQHWPSDVKKVALEAASKTVKAPQFFEPQKSASESRPDYLKPAATQQNTANSDLEPDQQKPQPTKLDIEVAKDEIEPTLAEKAFDKRRAEAAPSQPTISSTAERLDRPDLSKLLEQPKNAIDIPDLEPSHPATPRDLQASDIEAQRAYINRREGDVLNPLLQSELKLDNMTNLGSARGLKDRTELTNERKLDRELDKSMTRSNAVSERPSPIKQQRQDQPDKLSQSSVPLPKLGTPAPGALMDRPMDRETPIPSRSGDARTAANSSLSVSELTDKSRIEPSFGRGKPMPNTAKSPPSVPASAPNENAFLADPRFAMNNALSQHRPNRDSFSTASSTAPTSREPISTDGLGLGATDSAVRAMEPDLTGTDGKTDLQRRTSQGPKLGNPKSSLSPNVGGPSLEVGMDSWGAKFKDSPRKGPDLAKREFTMPEIRDAEITVDRFKRPETGGPKIARSEVPIPAPAFSQRLNRNNEQREDVAADLGALGPQTEAAIERGLQFLSRYQRADGSWRLEDFGERVELRSDSASTALALLSFQGAGYTHRQFKFSNVCERALKWIVEHQRPNGDLYVRSDAKSDANAWLYSHAIATLALCETYGMTQDESIKNNAQRAVDFLVQSQDPQAGGWRYQPKIGSDTSVTGWGMMALKSAELAGLNVPKQSYDGITKWLNASQAGEQQRFLYRYNWQAADTIATRHGRVPTPVMTSVGLLMRLYLGWRRTHPDMVQGTDWLLERLPAEGTTSSPQRDTYYWYYATQVIFHMGGERWKIWYESLYPMLIKSQNLNGEFAGSWDPNGKIPDAWGRFGGRLYVTTLNLLSLEVYYRHLPIYESTAE